MAAATSSFAAELRLGMIGLDTSHVPAFTKLINDTSDKNHVSGGKVVVAFKGGSKDVESSWSRVDGYTRQLQENYGVKIVDTIEELCQQADAVLIESLMHAVRGAAFAVPGALGAQEGGLIILCAIFGVPPEAALALSLVKRLPDLILGVPGLLAWQAMEGWHFHARGRASNQNERA